MKCFVWSLDAEGNIGGEPAWIDEAFALSADGRVILTTYGVWDEPGTSMGQSMHDAQRSPILHSVVASA